MIAISLALVSTGLFGAHVWELYQNKSPVAVRTIRRRV